MHPSAPVAVPIDLRRYPFGKDEQPSRAGQAHDQSHRSDLEHQTVSGKRQLLSGT